MKVLHVINSLDIGGAQRLVCDLLPHIARHCDVELLVCESVDNDFSRALTSAGITIHTLGISARSPRVIPHLIPWFRRYDIVHAHLFPMLYWAATASMFARCRMVFTEHSTSNRRRGKWFWHPIERFMYARYDAVITISQQTRDALHQWIGGKRPTLLVAENGVNLANFQCCDKPRKNQIIKIARFEPAKDHATLIRAMQHVTPELELLLVGDGSTRAVCEQMTRDCGVAERVHFLGARSDVPELIGQALIGVQSSHWEGFGLTAVEMMAGGLPVIACDAEGLRQVVEGAGLIFRHGDEQQLSSLINQLYHDADLRNNIAAACQQRAKKYSIATTAERYVELYKQLTQ